MPGRPLENGNLTVGLLVADLDEDGPHVNYADMWMRQEHWQLHAAPWFRHFGYVSPGTPVRVLP